MKNQTRFNLPNWTRATLLAFALLLPVFTWAAFDGGTGTKADPYLISNAAQLDSVRYFLTSHFKLVADIDLAEYLDEGGAGYAKYGVVGWYPIGVANSRFRGSFNGNYHVISNLVINRSSDHFNGLFGYYMPATAKDSIKNLGLLNPKTNGYDYTAVLAGYVNNATITGCFAINVAINAGGYSGGLLGQVDNGSVISNCYTTGTITSTNNGSNFGGIVGSSTSSNILYCYSTCNINTYNTVGGICGGSSGVTINNCIAINALLSISNSTGTIKRILSAGGTVNNCYGLNKAIINNTYITSEDLNDFNGKNVAYSELTDSAFYKTGSNWNTTAWDFENTWTMDTTATSPYPVLKKFALSHQKVHFKQPMVWLNIKAKVTDTIVAPAAGGVCSPIMFTCENPTLASFKHDSLFVHASGSIRITAKIDGNKFYDEYNETFQLHAFGTSGTKDDPYLVVDDVSLNEARKYLSAHFKLMADIDLNSYTNWEPIGTATNKFTGSFDGNGHVIKNLNINTTVSGAGLFGDYKPATANDSIKNLGIVNCNISGNNSIGAIVGSTMSATIYNCYSANGIISGSSTAVGGIAGASSSQIVYCYSSCNILGSNYTGGLVGQSYGTIINCFAANGSVNGGSRSGRITGHNGNAVNFCYGRDKCLVNNTYITSGQLNNNNGLNAPLTLLTDSAFYKDAANWIEAWNFTDTWTMDTTSTWLFPILKNASSIAQQSKINQVIAWDQIIPNGGLGQAIKLTALVNSNNQITYASDNNLVASVSNDTLYILGLGTANITAHVSGSKYFNETTATKSINIIFEQGEGTKTNPFHIHRATQFDSVRYALNAHYKLMADIDLSSFENWLPIGNTTNMFTGSFDGNYHIVSNLNIDAPTENYLGLFGYFKPATHYDTIKNIGIKNVNINGKSVLGSLCGAIHDGTIENSFSANIYISSESGYTIGGLVGMAVYSSNIKNCYSVGGIINAPSSNYIGGLVGMSERDITNCYSTNIINTNSANAASILGMVNNSSGRVINCLSLSPFINKGNRVIGTSSYGTFANNYAWEGALLDKTLVTNGNLTNYNGLNITLNQAKDSIFYKDASNWDTNPWDFNNIWTMDTTNISPFPVLKGFSAESQKVKHYQYLLWEQQFTGKGAYALNANKGMNGLFYTLANNDIAHINNDTLYVTGYGKNTIMAIQPGSEFFIADTIAKEYEFLFANGDGSKNNPYQVENVSQLDSVHNYLDKHFKLIADIDLSSYANWNPIGNNSTPFKGSFDGNNHVIYNLTIDTTISNVGLFGYYFPATANDSIKNLGLVNAKIVSTESQIGGIVGQIASATIFNCFVKQFELNGPYTIGGIAGYGNSTKIINCFADVTIHGQYHIGGIVGNIGGGSMVTNCYSNGYIAGWGIGGISGQTNFSNCTITNCYTTMELAGENGIGGISGYAYYATIKNCLALNPSISSTDNYLYRVYTSGFSNTLATNYAWQHLVLNSDTAASGALNDNNGQSIDIDLAKSSLFFTDAANWNNSWDFTDVWCIDNVNQAPFPILKGINANYQQLKYRQKLCWNQELKSPGIGNFIKLTALKGASGLNVIYTSSNPDIASISNDTLFIHALGKVDIKAKLPADNYFLADSVIKSVYIIFENGSGSKNNPYLIERTGHFDSVRYVPNAHYKLMVNLDMSGYQPWQPIESLTGSFDGNGYIISNITINETDADYSKPLGVFRSFIPSNTNDSIKNLGLVNISISALQNQYTGAIVGHCKGGVISSCFTSGSIISESYSGGIAGMLENAYVTNCYSHINNTDGSSGGVCGYSQNSVLSNVYTTGISHQAGLVNYMYQSTLKNSFAANAYIQGGSRLYSSYGYASSYYNYAYNGIVINSNVVSSSNHDNNNGLDTPIDYLIDSAFYTNSNNWDEPWDFTNIWTMDTTNILPYPILKVFAAQAQKIKLEQKITWQQTLSGEIGDTIILKALGGSGLMPIHFTSDNSDVALIIADTMFIKAKGYAQITAKLAGNQFFLSDSVTIPFALMEGEGNAQSPYLVYNHIELNAIRNNNDKHYKLMADIDLTSIENWVPISFSGAFNGNNHTISNLNAKNEYASFIDYYSGNDTIKNLHFVNANVNGKYNSSIIVGELGGGGIINCTVSGRVYGRYSAAGISVFVSNAVISNCKNYADITAEYDDAGGIVCGLYSYSTIKNCVNYGKIMSNETSGGVVAYNNCSIVECANMGNVTGNYQSGGIVSYNEGSIFNCYNTGTICASDYAGGIAAITENELLAYCYSTGIVNGNTKTTYVGGITGNAYNNNIVNNLAINAKINTDSIGNRIAGENMQPAKNYAWNNMFVNSSKTISDSSLNGISIDMSLIKDQLFYTDAQYWSDSVWNFETVWTMDASVSPYPILKTISAQAQKVQHSQAIDTSSWTQVLAQTATVTDTIKLTAAVESPSQLLAYTSSNPAVAVVSNDTVFVKGIGTATIYAYYPATEFYTASDSLTKTITVTQKGNQVINWNQNLAATYGEAAITLNANATTEFAVSYTSDNNNVASITGNTIAIVGAGTANITASQAGNENYNAAADVVTAIVVNKAAITATAENKSKVYGSANPELTVAYAGFVNGEDATVLDEAFVATTEATAESNAGTYAINLNSVTDNNYEVATVAGELTVTKADLTATAENKSKVYGSANPELTVAYAGFVNGDDATVLDEAVVAATEATAESNAGTYAITLNSVTDNNYTVATVAGELSVTKAAITATAENKTKVYGSANPELTVAYAGFVNGDNDEVIDTKPVATTTATAESPAGKYDITLSGGDDNNYSFVYVTGILTVTDVVIEPVLSVSVAELAIGAQVSSTVSFDITSNIDWDITSSASWLHANPENGNGNKTVTLAADENPTTEKRSATITIKGNNVDDVVITVTQDAGVGIDDNNAVCFSVYPNPATDNINVSIANSLSDGTVEVFNIAGVKVCQQPLTGIITNINVAKMPQGLYIIKVLAGGHTAVSRFVKN